jgi:SAM-dependent methyltransferase
MTRQVRLRELLVGVEGLALLRRLYDGTDADADERLAEIRRLLDAEELARAEPTGEADPRTAYRLWAESYDESDNPIVAMEEGIVRSMLDGLPAGRALDAACGTGRHARHLVDRGHEVLGVDLSAYMLRRAAENVPDARFVEGDLRDLPAEDGRFDLAVCALALAHLPDVAEGIAELARILRPGGRLVLSVLHPLQAHLGWQAPYTDAHGRRGFVREYPHNHADYLAAFRSAGLHVLDCVEPELDAELVRAKRRAYGHIPEATKHAYVGLPAVLVWNLEKGGQ